MAPDTAGTTAAGTTAAGTAAAGTAAATTGGAWSHLNTMVAAVMTTVCTGSRIPGNAVRIQGKVLGSLRRPRRKNCDFLIRLPTTGGWKA